MTKLQTLSPELEAHIRERFHRQQAMISMGASLASILPGEARIEMPFNPNFTQQDGFIHAGVITTIVDSACGYAAFTLIPTDKRILTVEFKVNFISPARGEKFIAIGKVVKAGRTLTVCSGEVLAVENGESKPIALMQATMIAVS
jgi:uncharacterized protein (TIGR00369 family)